MSRTKAPNKKITEKIREVLSKNPQGLWTREIARQSGVSKSCVQIYLVRHMANEIEEILSVSGLVKIFRLKSEKNVRIA